MFGQTSAFGSPTPNAGSSPFGQQQPQQQQGTSGGFGGFGTSTTNSTSPFGVPTSSVNTGLTGFGGSTTNTNAFGAPVAGSGGFSSTTPFGASTPAPATGGGLFGSTSTALAPSTGFGAPVSAAGGGLFGSSTAPVPAPSGGLFGAPAPAPSTGLFGAPVSAPAGGLFGSSSTAPAPAFGSGFGGASGGFGSSTTTTTTGFGAPAPAPSGGIFGASSTATSPFGAAGGQAGGANVTSQSARFEATSAMDGQTRINLQSITAQPTFQGMSYEELRLADYKSGNRGGATAAAPVGGLFGSPTPAPSGGLFGSTAPAPSSGLGFGAAAPSTSPFNAASSTGFGGFGSPAPAPFGAPAPAPGGGLFGSTAPAPSGGLFGSPAPTPATGLFGAPAPAPVGGLFGAPAPSTGFGFGGATSPAPAPVGGLFGAPAPAPTGGLFGAPAAPAPGPTGGLFGAPAPAPTGGLFGAPATGGGLFGSSAPAPTPSGSLFGAPAPVAGGGLFGSATNTPGTNLFGSTTAPAPSTMGGLFGSPTPAPTGGLFGSSLSAPAPSSGLFGTPAAAPVGGLFSPSGAATSAIVGATLPSAPTAEQVLEQKLALIEHQRQENEKLEPWRSSSYSTAASALGHTDVVSTNASAVYRATTSPSATRTMMMATPRSLTKIRPRGYAPSRVSTIGGGVSTGTAATPMGKFAQLSSPSTPLTTPGVKNLVIRAEVFTATPKVKHRIQYLTNGEVTDSNGGAIATPNHSVMNGTTPMKSNQTASTDRYRLATASPIEGQYDITSPMVSTSSKNLLPVLTKPHYTISPNLANFNEADLASMNDFTVSHDVHGSISWEGAVDVRGVNIDDSVIITAKEAAVYGREEELGTKPPLGTKLNRPAIIILNNIFPKEGTDPEKYKVKITKSTHKMGAKMINYDVDNGVWKFRVEHFSRYGLDDDDDSEEEVIDEDIAPTHDNQASIVPWSEIVKPDGTTDFFKPRSQVKKLLERDLSSSRYTAPSLSAPSFDTTDGESDEALVDLEMTDTIDQPKDLLIAAEEAFGVLTKSLEDIDAIEIEKKEIRLPLDDDSIVNGDVISQQERPIIPIASFNSCAPSISSHVASKVGAPFRPNRSFRVGWSPNNTLVTIRDRTKLVFVRPKLKVGNMSESMLEVHLKHSKFQNESNGEVVRSLPTNGTHYIEVCSSLNGYSISSRDSKVSYGVCKVVEALYGQEEHVRVNDKSMIPVIKNRSSPQMLAKFQRRQKYILGALQCLQEDSSPYPILNAVCVNDLEKATKLATARGYFQLAVILSNYNGASDDLVVQIQLWKSTGHLNSISDEEVRRVFMIIGNDLSYEHELCASKDSKALCWVSRLGLALVQGEDLDLKDILANYEAEVSAGTAPYPVSLCASNNESIIYCIFKLCATFGGRDGTITLSDTLHPSGYALNSHDYELAWHIGHLLTSLGISSLSAHQQIHVMESMVSQLLYCKLYHWAVYVALCAFPLQDLSIGQMNHFHIALAKKVINGHLYFMKESQISWLIQEVGVPVEWIEESKAAYAGYIGDKVKHVTALSNAGLYDDCARATRTLLVPEAIVIGGQKKQALKTLLVKLANATEGDRSNFFWADENGCGVVLEILQLSDRVDAYISGNLGYSQDLIHNELQIVEKLKCHIADPGDTRSSFGVSYLACHVNQPTFESTACIINLIESLCAFESKLRLLLNLSFEELNEINLLEMPLTQIIAIECQHFGVQSSFNPTDIDRLRGLAGYITA